MAKFKPTRAGPKSLRSLYHWVWKQLSDVGDNIGDEGGTLPPDPPPDPGHQHWHDNLINVTPDQHHNQVHDFLGPDHTNIPDLIFRHPTVAAMVADTTLAPGDWVRTDGYYAVDDGGGAHYLIAAPTATDGFSDHTLSNGNAALLQSHYVHVLQWGVTNDGVDSQLAQDNLETAAIAAGSMVFIPAGDYNYANFVTYTHDSDSWVMYEYGLNNSIFNNTERHGFAVSLKTNTGAATPLADSRVGFHGTSTADADNNDVTAVGVRGNAFGIENRRGALVGVYGAGVPVPGGGGAFATHGEIYHDGSVTSRALSAEMSVFSTEGKPYGLVINMTTGGQSTHPVTGNPRALHPNPIGMYLTGDDGGDPLFQWETGIQFNDGAVRVGGYYLLAPNANITEAGYGTLADTWLVGRDAVAPLEVLTKQQFDGQVLDDHADVTIDPAFLKEGQGLWFDADTGQWRNRGPYQEAFPTGLADGGELNIGPGVNDIEVIAGVGVVTDSYAVPLAPPVFTALQWEQINTPITAAPAQAGSVVWFAIRDTGVPVPDVARSPTLNDAGGIPVNVGELVQYAQPPSPTLSRQQIFLGVAVHNGSEWKEISNPKVVNQAAETLREYVISLNGPSYIFSGAEVTETGTFEVAQAEGVIWEQNRNWHNDKSDPNRETLPAANPVQFRYVNADFTSVGALTSTFDPDQYTPAPGTGAPVGVPGGGNTATIQKLYLDPANNYWVLWGQYTYASFFEAEANLATDLAKSTIPFVLQNSILLGYAVMEKGKNNWDPNEAVFIPAPAAGVGGSGGTPITEHDLLSGITPDNHHNQVHLLYGTDHSDVDSAGPLAGRNVLGQPNTVGPWTPQYRTEALPYAVGGTYYPQQMVFAEGYLSIANKETTDIPYPQPQGIPQYAYEGLAPTAAVTAKQVVFGQRYKTPVDVAYQLTRYRIYTVTGNTYRVFFVLDPETNPVFTELGLFTANTTGWVEFNQTPIVLGYDTHFDLVAIADEPDPTPTIFSGDWDYQKPNNPTTPASGVISHANREAQSLRVNKTDNNAGDRSAELATLEPGDFIEIENGLRWAIQAITDNGTWIDFTVAPAQQDSQGGVNKFNFETTVATPITRMEDVNWWGLNPPTNGAEVEGLYIEDGQWGDIVPNTSAYGTDVFIQELTQSPDWDIFGIPGGGSGGGGRVELEPHFLDFHEDVDTTGKATNDVLKWTGSLWQGGRVDYSELTGVPSTFPPSAHTLGSHSDVAINTPVNGNVLIYSNGDWVNANVTFPSHGELVGLADDDHLQYHTDARGDARYYLKAQVDAGFAPIVHTHVEADITDLDKYTQAQVDALLADKTDDTDFNAHVGNTSIHFADVALPGQFLRSTTGWVEYVPPTVITDHGNLNGLGDDDHPQYLNNARGDARYPALGDYNTHVGNSSIHFADVTAAGQYLRTNTGWVEYIPPTVITDHGALTGLGDDDHPQYLNNARGDVRYAQVVHTHVVADITDFPTEFPPAPHTLGSHSDVLLNTPVDGQALIFQAGVWVNQTLPTGVTDHGLLNGLGDDDHPQYLTEARGDARYPLIGDLGNYVLKAGDTMSGALKVEVGAAVTAGRFFTPSGTHALEIERNSNGSAILMKRAGVDLASFDMLTTALEIDVKSGGFNLRHEGNFSIYRSGVLRQSLRNDGNIRSYRDGNGAWMEFYRAGVLQGDIQSNPDRFRIRSKDVTKLELESGVGRSINFFPGGVETGRFAPTGEFLVGLGTAGAPAVSFLSDQDTGMYSPTGANTIAFAVGGFEAARFSNLGRFVFAPGIGSASSPSMQWDGSPNTGIYQQTADVISFSVNSVERVRISEGTLAAPPNNPSNSPGFSFFADSNTGMGHNGPDDAYLGAGGQQVIEWQQQAIQFNKEITKTLSVRVDGGTDAAYFRRQDYGATVFFEGGTPTWWEGNFLIFNRTGATGVDFGPAIGNAFRMGYLSFRGADGTGTAVEGASYETRALGAFSASNRGTEHIFSAAAQNSTSVDHIMRIKATGVEGLWTDFGTQNVNAKFQKLTQAQYDGITPDANTIYFIVG